MAIVDPGDLGLERAEESAGANALDYLNLNLKNLRLRTKFPVADALTAASCTRTIEGPSTLALTFDDKDLAMLRTGGIEINQDGRLDPVEVTLDTLKWRLVKAQPSLASSQLKLTFEEQAVALLKEHSKHLVVSRANVTRAEFAHRLVREVHAVRLGFYSPEEHFAQVTGRPPRDRKSRDAQRKPGFADGVKLKIQGATADTKQLREIETSLTVADEENATGRARQALIVAGIGESGFQAIMNRGGSPYGGVFQGNIRGGVFELHDTEGMARHFLKGGKGYQAGGAIAAAAAHPDWSPGRIALEVEGSLANFGGNITRGEHFYQVGDDPQHSHISEARAILDAWDGGASGAESQRTVVKPYQFTRGLPGKRENSWQCLQRLAEEVGWRCFVVGGVVYFISEEQLFMSRARAEIGYGDPGLVDLDADWDNGKTIATVTLTVDAQRWGLPPGSVVALRDLGAFNGRWLVNEVERTSLFDPETQVTLTKPIPRKREPAADTIQVPRDVTDDAAKGVDAAYKAAKHLADLKIPYVWGGGHGFDLDDYNPNGGFDCSSGVSMVLHRAGLFDSDQATNSTGLMTWGTPGKGRQLTVYANADHVFMVFDLPNKKPQAWEFRHTGTVGGFSDRAQRPGFENGFTARHAGGT